MRHNFSKSLFRSACLTLATFAAALGAGCSSGREVTLEAINQAKAQWKAAGIHDYTVEWKTTQPSGHYLVDVVDDKVTRVEGVSPDGRRYELHPGQPRFYSVDGLFTTIADEFAQLGQERPFSQPRGTRVILRFETDPKLGYPVWYRRDVMGGLHNTAIDVLRLSVPDTSNRLPETQGSASP